LDFLGEIGAEQVGQSFQPVSTNISGRIVEEQLMARVERDRGLGCVAGARSK
jgi:hypothetical protein